TFGGDRRIALCRELTKLHEEILRMTLDGAVAYYAENAPRGEFVLILEGASETPAAEAEGDRMALALEAVQRRIEAGETLKDAVKMVSADLGVKKNALYKLALGE
ncbi:MAG: 16S rRNA (cytidine(1402)-2'-O)-methyltransferase, partial [Butyricicoccus sp.]